MALSMKYTDQGSDGDCLVPVVGTSGPQECIGGTCKVFYSSFCISREWNDPGNAGNDEIIPEMIRLETGLKIQLNENRSRTDPTNE
jgi:hypothetical protein